MSLSTSSTNKPYIYPNRKASSFWERLKVAWRIVVRGEYFPAPYDWYETLYPIVSNEYSNFAQMAVDKSEREFAGKYNQELKRKEALQWMRHYASEAGKKQDIQPWLANFLVEWWVARKKGRV